MFISEVAESRHRCFPVNFVKLLRTFFFMEHLWWLLLIVSNNACENYLCGMGNLNEPLELVSTRLIMQKTSVFVFNTILKHRGSAGLKHTWFKISRIMQCCKYSKNAIYSIDLLCEFLFTINWIAISSE